MEKKARAGNAEENMPGTVNSGEAAGVPVPTDEMDTNETEQATENIDILTDVPRELLEVATMILKGVDITEVFSPERVTKIASEHGLKAGLSMDLRTGWDFRRKEDRRKAKKYILEEKPVLVIGSPVCTPFSTLQRWNWGRTKEWG